MIKFLYIFSTAIFFSLQHYDFEIIKRENVNIIDAYQSTEHWKDIQKAVLIQHAK